MSSQLFAVGKLVLSFYKEAVGYSVNTIFFSMAIGHRFIIRTIFQVDSLVNMI